MKKITDERIMAITGFTRHKWAVGFFCLRQFTVDATVRGVNARLVHARKGS